jgi:murein DD-endopeptidase MepM/ murein hydrolase activator NlpD
MQLIITDTWLAKSKAFHLSGAQLVLATLGAALGVMVLAAALYHWVFMKGAREGWPLVGTIVRLMVKDEAEQRDRYLRENLDAMAKRLGEMQAKMLQIETLGERVSGLAGLNPNDIKGPPGRGGAASVGRPLGMQELQSLLSELETASERGVDVMTVIESRLFDLRVKKMLMPTQHPVASGNLGSSFGWRIDPITGRSALHEGLDFQADRGTSIVSAAAGVVVTQEFHSAFGNLLEIDHGNDLITRYAHSSRVLVKKGDIVKRGQKIAEVGSTGRSTGAHLHFEVLVRSVPQDPQKFLSAGQNLPTGIVPAGPTVAQAAVGAASKVK